MVMKGLNARGAGAGGGMGGSKVRDKKQLPSTLVVSVSRGGWGGWDRAMQNLARA